MERKPERSLVKNAAMQLTAGGSAGLYAPCMPPIIMML